MNQSTMNSPGLPTFLLYIFSLYVCWKAPQPVNFAVGLQLRPFMYNAFYVQSTQRKDRWEEEVRRVMDVAWVGERSTNTEKFWFIGQAVSSLADLSMVWRGWMWNSAVLQLVIHEQSCSEVKPQPTFPGWHTGNSCQNSALSCPA